MPKKQSTAAKKARAAARQDGEKYTIALREAEACGPAAEFATATRVTVAAFGQAWRVRALDEGDQVLAEWPIELPTADSGHVDRWLARQSVRRTTEWWPEGSLVDGASVPITRSDSPAAAAAFVEAHFRTALSDRPCRCSGRGEEGTCHHGTICGDDECTDDGQPCQGRLIHADRYPGSMWGVTVWEDLYECAESGARSYGEATLPDLPWGRIEKQGDTTGTVVFDDVRHPAFGVEDEGSWGCGECGADSSAGYGCNCEPPEEYAPAATADEPDEDDFYDPDEAPEPDPADYYSRDYQNVAE